MKDLLDYHDIQGNILVNYAEFGFIKARYLFFNVKNVEHGMDFVKEVRKLVTPASLWTKGEVTLPWELPAATTNIAFTYNGLKRLGLPVLTLQSFPDEFIIGMNGRRTILGDDGQSSPKYWDKIWKNPEQVHMFISIDARTEEDRENRYKQILDLLSRFKGVELLDGHRTENKGKTLCYQDAAALNDSRGFPTNKEHFGYADGISNPFFKGMTEEMGSVMGGGKKNGPKLGYGNPELTSTWAPLETGEFVLGYKDEAMEYPVAPTPPLISKNGSFMVFSKFHENVGKFNDYLNSEGAKFPGGKEALAAKFSGRWRNGAPITSFPTQEKADEIASQRQKDVGEIGRAIAEKNVASFIASRTNFNEINKKFVAFDYDKDSDGSRCPVGAHCRRANPRGSLEFEKNAFDTPSALDNRRRMIRRGLPYGISRDPGSNDGEHGTIIMSIVSSIKRQFEFVFQQWLNYGNDFKLANDKDPIVGNHAEINGLGQGRMIVQGEKTNPPQFLSKIPLFVETRGGEYFFIPSLTALKMIGDGIVDPT